MPPEADPQRARRRTLVARAAAPSERGAWPCFQPRPTDEATRQARAAASALAAGADATRVSQLLAWRGLTLDQLQATWSDVEYVEGVAAPPWVAGLEELLTPEQAVSLDEPAVSVADVLGLERARAAGLDPQRPWRFQRIFAPLLRVARGRLGARLAAQASDVHEAARHGLLVQLARRFHESLYALLLTPEPGTERSVHEYFFPGAAPVLAEAWLALGEAYPACARLVAQLYVFWDEAMTELLAHVEADREALAHAFRVGAPLGALVEYLGGLGDAHAGRSVASLTFASGLRVVYKPKDLRVAVAYQQLVRGLAEFGLEPAPRTRTYVIRETHAWEEHVRATPCTDEAQVRDYHRRVGMHARLVQLLDGSDFTAPNVVACGDQPTLIDLETLLRPHVAQARSAALLGSAAAEQAADSPFSSGLLTLKVPGLPGRRAADLSPLASEEQRRAPFGSEEAAESFEAGAACVVLDGTIVSSTRYFAEVVEGYLTAARALTRSAGQAQPREALLAAFDAVPVRFIYRSTHVYVRLLRESLKADALRDAWAYERATARLWRTVQDPPSARVAAAEIEALRDLDIPFFTACVGDDVLALPGGPRLPGYFDDTTLERVRRRWHAASTRDEEQERALVGSALFALAPGTERRPATRVGPARGTRTAPDWLAQARALGALLLDWALPGTQDEVAWLGLSYHPWMDTWRLLALAPDLLTGSAGLAITLAELHVATGEARFARAARAACGAAQRALDLWPREQHARAQQGRPWSPVPCGAYYGLGAWAYACVRVGQLLHDTLLVDSAVTGLTEALALVPDELHADVVSGRAGLLLATAACLRATATSAGLAAHGSLLARTLEDRRDPRGQFPAGLHPAPAPLLDSLIDGPGGIGYACARWYTQVADVGRARLAVAPGGEDGPTGAALLVRLGHASLGTLDVSSVLDEVEAWLAAQPAAPEAQLVLAELALVGARLTAGDRALRLRARAGVAASVLGAACDDTGAFFASRWAADRHRLCALTGVGAVIRLFLALETAAPYVSLRLLE
jgi:type 2 lantibiotic biosynthesis protein LanM